MCRIYAKTYSSWINGSGYSDPTAGKALDRIERELRQKEKQKKEESKKA